VLRFFALPNTIRHSCCRSCSHLTLLGERFGTFVNGNHLLTRIAIHVRELSILKLKAKESVSDQVLRSLTCCLVQLGQLFCRPFYFSQTGFEVFVNEQIFWTLFLLRASVVQHLCTHATHRISTVVNIRCDRKVFLVTTIFLLILRYLR
jgi:hypothetical protein